MERTVTDSVATQSPKRLIPTRWTMPPTVKRREIRCSSASRMGALRNVMRSNLFFVSTKSILFYSASKAIKYQIKHYFDLSNCKFTRSFLISAIWRGSPCRRSSDDANTDWVHCPSPRCRVKVADCDACDLEPTSARRWVCDRDRGDWCQRRDDC